MPKLKILFISHSPYLFGAENCALSLIKGLDPDRFDAAVVLPSDGPFKQRLDELGVRTHVLPLEWWVKNEGRLLHAQHEIPLALDRLLRIVDQEKPDLIHSNTSVVCWGAIAAAMTGVRHVWHVHEILNGHPSLESILPLPLLYEAMNLLTDQVVAVSSAVRDELAGFVDAEKVQLIHNGVPYHAAENPGNLRRELAASPEQLIAVTVTSLQKYKGIDNLLAAAARVCEQDDRLLFVIAGSGPPEALAAMREQIKELKLEGRVFHLGFRDDIAEILAGADLFVLPSNKEAFPLVVLEAMSHAKPVVATDCGGTWEMIAEGETGFVVPVGDPDALAAKILKLCKDRKRMLAMGEAARLRYTESFTSEHYIGAFTGLYSDMPGAQKTRLTSRQASLLSSFIEAYVAYLETMRVIPKLEQELSYQKRQLAENNALLAQKQDALLNSEREKVSKTQQHAEQILALVSQIESNAQKQITLEAQLEQKTLRQADLEEKLAGATRELASERELRLEQEARLAKKRTRLALLDERLGQLEEELVCAVELRSELKNGRKPAEILNQDERITLIIEKIAQNRELHIELENKVLQQSSDLAGREEQIKELQDLLDAADKVQAKLEVELRDRDDRISQIEEHLAAECKRVEERIRAQEAGAETVKAGLEAQLKHRAVEAENLSQRIRQIQEEVLKEHERIQRLVQSHQATLASSETEKADLQMQLKHNTVELEGQRDRNRQISAEVVIQGALGDENLRQKEDTILSLGEVLETTAHRLKIAEEELVRVRRAREEETRLYEQLLRGKEQKVEELLTSLSWKVTGPLRKAYDLARLKK